MSAVGATRIPFEEAISEPLLLKKRFDALSVPQQTVLLALYGCALPTPDHLRAWAVLQGSCKYDDLGYVTDVTSIPYIPKEYRQLWAILGRRSGKTDKLQATIIAYEATLAGHMEFVSAKQEVLIYLIAHRLDVATANLSFIRQAFDESPLLSKEVVKDNTQAIRLRNGISIVPSPPSLRAQRGMAIPSVVMDEVGFWFSNPDAANPDFEVERAVEYSQLQFPHWTRVGISTPWVKEGLLWRYRNAGTEGCRLHPTVSREEYQDILVCFAPTAAIDNPRVTRKALARLQTRDPEAFAREALCEFPDSVSGFLSATLLSASIEAGVGEREPRPRPGESSNASPIYVAAIDPAFRQDSFAFTIVHRDTTRGIVVDVVRRWTPIRGARLNPKDILAEIKPLLDAYRTSVLYSDQYQLESLQQLANDFGITVEGVDFTARSKAKIFGNLQQLVNQKKLVLLDPATTDAAGTMFTELTQLERRVLQAGGMSISAPEGKHDDMAAVLALAAYKAVWLLPEITPVKDKEPTLFERGMATIRRRKLEAFRNWDD